MVDGSCLSGSELVVLARSGSLCCECLAWLPVWRAQAPPDRLATSAYHLPEGPHPNRRLACPHGVTLLLGVSKGASLFQHLEHLVELKLDLHEQLMQMVWFCLIVY